ncbi:MAG: NRDE family protein [Nitrospirota bacterium]
MCTVSFIPRSQGFYLAMNRDEKRVRFTALAPAVAKSGRRRAVLPREPSGGTWISANDAGVCLALINWHRIEREPKNGLRSRGIVVRELAGKSTAAQLAVALKKLPLRQFRPFRLIAIFPGKTRVTEWRWNLERLTRHDHQWQRQHWFSSGFEERAAERVRRKVCASFVARADAPGYGLKWLRKLHRSHAPKRGPFSVCMHRPDATTVSYTEVAVSDRRATMRYKPGPPCAVTRTTIKTLPIISAVSSKLRL